MEKHNSWSERLRHERLVRGWSREYIAERLKASKKTVDRWERGEVYPNPYNLQMLVELYGKRPQELGFLPDQEVPAAASTLNSSSLSPVQTSALHTDPITPHTPITPPSVAQGILSSDGLLFSHLQSSAVSSTMKSVLLVLESWDGAPHVERFYGREQEQTLIKGWLLDEGCRLVAILGIGGVGKTTFATLLAQQVKHKFEYVFWRSLQNAPAVEDLLAGCLQEIFDQRRVSLPQNLDGQLTLLLTFLQQHRCLLLLDNVESLFQSDQRAGRFVEMHGGYERLFQWLGESDHQSCLLLTSREKPQDLVRMEGDNSRVRVLSLSGIAADDGQLLLKGRHLAGSDETWRHLVNLYAGNPLALKLVAEPISTIFGGDIAEFLREKETIFGDIQDLLDEQMQRLAETEKHVLYWLAIEREAVSRNELWIRTQPAITRSALFVALDSLQRRSLLEVHEKERFTLQPVVLQYITERLVEQVYSEIREERIGLLGSHALLLAQAKDDTRTIQEQQIVAPLIQRLLQHIELSECEAKLKGMLALLRQTPLLRKSYAAGNILNLLLYLSADLRGLQCDHLAIRQAYLQGAFLPEVNFAHADLATSVFTDTFSSILCVAVSPDGSLLAAGTTTSEIRVWRIDGMIPLFALRGHTDGIRSVAFSPDGRLLASGSEDQDIRLWNVETGQCCTILHEHTDWVRSVAFSPDGQLIASASEDCTVRVWNVTTASCLHKITAHTQRVRAVAFSPNGEVLASGSDDQSIRLWWTDTWECRTVLHGHTHAVRTLAFAPQGALLASGSEDKTICLWNIDEGTLLDTLSGHTQRVSSLSFSTDGQSIASCSDDLTVCLWDVKTRACLQILSGHTHRIWSLTFVPGRELLISASEDQTLRFWDTAQAICIRTLQSSTSLVKALAFSPNGCSIVDGTEEQTVRVWEIASGRCVRILKEHANRVRTVSYSLDGQYIASGSEDETVRVWDAASGRCLHVLTGHTHLVRSVAFSPDSSQLASSSYDGTIRLWESATGCPLKTLTGYQGTIWSASWLPDGKTLVSGGDDRTVRLWNAEVGVCCATLTGHTHRVWSVACSPDGRRIASTGDDNTIRIWEKDEQHSFSSQNSRILTGHTAWTRTVAFSPDGMLLASGSHDTTVRLWDVASGRPLHILQGHSNCVWSVGFSPDGQMLGSAGDDGTIRLWDVRSGKFLKTLVQERPYEGMNISFASGLLDAQKEALLLLGAMDTSP